MEGIKITLAPNVEKDYQAFSFEDMDITHEEWLSMNEDEREELIYASVRDNICGMIDSIEEY